VQTPRSLVPTALRKGANLLLGTRRWSDAQVELLARDFSGSVLEIGSGRQDLGFEAYSLRRVFDPAAVEFVQSDLNADFGHEVVDVTTMTIEDRYDLVLCLYVLEHVYDVEAAVANIHRALRPAGRVAVAVPHLYPYHDEPIDFWRFTEYSLRRLFSSYASVTVQHRGPRRLPKGLFVLATK
jgi:SAM-dependent methyltransferase